MKTHKITVSKNKWFGYQKDIYVQNHKGVLKVIHAETILFWGLIMKL